MKNEIIILGISCFYHDSSAALLINDEVIAACQEERFTRKKFDNSFPINSINFCLNKSNLNEGNIDYIVFYEDPELKLDRILKTNSILKPFSFFKNYKILNDWVDTKYYIEQYIYKYLPKFIGKIILSKHHFSHAASTFFTSPFEKSAILTIDGVGEWSSSSIGYGENNNINILEEQKFPNSVGILYSAFTSYLGFKILSGEYKLMGLAPYGNPKYVDVIKNNIVKINEDGSIILNQKFFEFLNDKKIYNNHFDNLFDNLSKEIKLNEKHCDIASSIQQILEEIVIKMAKYACKITNSNNLCLAGGVALNCVANSKIKKQKEIENLWIQPASGDSGGALGGALGYLFNELKFKRNLSKNIQKYSYLGPDFDNDTIKIYLDSYDFKYTKYKESDIPKIISNYIQQKKIIGLFQSRMEYGPRALGNRSIIADPRDSNMQKKLNLKIKFRESFRPFAPIVLMEKISEWFVDEFESPYMLFTNKVLNKKQIHLSEEDYKVKGLDQLNIARSEIPSVTHVDYSARIQTVDSSSNPFLYKILYQFYKETDCPILINTSFNVRGEPIVCNPFDALKCFMNTNMDLLCIGNYILEKELQSKTLMEDNYLNNFDKD